jgi:hypothetical protein
MKERYFFHLGQTLFIVLTPEQMYMIIVLLTFFTVGIVGYLAR